MRSGEFYSKGKFLLSGEYFVLYGAKALAVPLKFGQRMFVDELPDSGILRWETYVLDKLWFSASFHLEDMGILKSSNEKTAFFIQKLLKEGRKLQPGLNRNTKGYYIQNHIDFDINWGLGSSSSLVSNLAYWLDIDPFALYSSSFQGSGYDVFCARAGKPILYQLKDHFPEVHETYFKPSFTDNLYFVYLERKQDSQESVREFKARKFMDDHIIRKVSDLTDAMLKAASLSEFLTVMRSHEETLSAVLGLPMVKEGLFPDFQGEIKSLGAWGGDFVMVGTSLSQKEVKEYFSRKNRPVVFKYSEIVY